MIDPFEAWEKHWCDVCSRECNGIHEWKIHLASKKHKRMSAYKNKRMRDPQAEESIRRERAEKRKLQVRTNKPAGTET